VNLLLFALQAGNIYGQNTVGLTKYSDDSNEGYTLFSPTGSRTTYLIDNCGFKVHEWSSNFDVGLMAYLLEDGRLLRGARVPNSFLAGGSAGRVELISWDNELLWSHNFNSEFQQSHHDIAPLPNGNFLVLLWDAHVESDLIQMGRDTTSLPPSGLIWSEKIQEIKPIGTDQIEIVWEWNSWNHLIQDYDEEKSNFGVVSEHPELLNINYPLGSFASDWMHINSIEYNPVLDQIALSSRNFNEFYIIDHSTTTEEARTDTGGIYGQGGNILFRWGNPRAYDQGNISDQKLFGQHDASWIEEGNEGQGNILVFNNGSSRPDNLLASSIEEIELKESNDGFYTLNEDGTFGPEGPSWQFPEELTEQFYARRISGAQRLGDNNTLICDGLSAIFFEVDETGKVVWEYKSPIASSGVLSQGDLPIGSDVFKIRRYPYNYPAFEDKVLESIETIENNPNDTDCQLSVSNNHVSVQEKFNIYPNPFHDNININLPDNKTFIVEVLNQIGQKITYELLSGPSTLSYDFEENGIYIINIIDSENNDSQTQTIIKL